MNLKLTTAICFLSLATLGTPVMAKQSVAPDGADTRVSIGQWCNKKVDGVSEPTILAKDGTGVYRVTFKKQSSDNMRIQFSTQKSATDPRYVAVLTRGSSIDLRVKDTVQVEITGDVNGKACGTYSRISN